MGRASPSAACFLLFLASAVPGRPQTPPQTPSESLPAASVVQETDAVAPARFIAAHGRRALLMGYSGMGLEAWAYPFQLFSGYHVAFLPQDAVDAIDGATILRRIEYRPDEIIRIYVGPDFIVREHLFVPLDQPGAILTYDTEGRRPVDIRVTFLPVLNLMWPGGVGGQDPGWSDALHGYVLSQSTTGVRALIASPQEAAHTAIVNSTLRQSLTQSMVLHPTAGSAQLFAALEDGSSPEGSVLRLLEQQQSALRAASIEHVQAVLDHGIQIRTPDADLNRALVWSRLALDQAWVCNPRVGCGIVAGYGPSRGMRRPQYAWFFAGDGLVATRALLDAGDTQRALQELAFIFKYQNPANGMIWHEISQSAGYIDWARYPYMYVHVDITFDFLASLGDAWTITGDAAFFRDHWNQIAAAYGYCRSLIDPATALPKIPTGKEGMNEQQRMSEDAGLSASWIAAASAYQQLALATGHTAEAASAAAAADAARHAIAARYWDPKTGFWIAGFSPSGSPLIDERSHPNLLGNGFFTPAEENAALDRLAASSFETDWGARGLASASPGYNPNSYGAGSVSALGTAEMAAAFWRDHRPAVAAPIFHSLLSWLQLDSLGHIHELTAGDFFHPEVESVPEQTWSSAGFLDAAIRGLLGIDVDTPNHRLTIAPHLDPRWSEVSIAQISVGAAQVAATFHRQTQQLDADFTARNGPVHLVFAPEIPVGATAVRATINGHAVPVSLELHPEDEHARVHLDFATDSVHCRITWSGGVSVLAPLAHPSIGDPSRQLKLVSLALDHRQLTLQAEVASPTDGSLKIETPWRIESVHGGTATPTGNDCYTITFADGSATAPHFQPARLTLQFQSR